MKAAKLFGVGDLRTVDVPRPEPGPGDVLVRVEAAGVCGTDRHILKGEFPSRPPVILGHELSGIVVARGDAVAGIAIGDRVTIDPNITCGTCPACRVGRVNLCHNLSAIGVHRDGGFAEYCLAPATQAVALPAKLDPLHGALCEPLACCIHGTDIGAPRPGERAIVIGGGVIGLLTAQLLRNAGAEVMVLTRQKDKRDLALSLGAAATAATLDEALALWPEGGDLVIECAGVPETVSAAQRLASRGGRIVVLGVLPAGAKVAIEPFDLLVREIQLHHSFLNPFTQGRAARMIADGSIRIAPLITRTITLSEAAAAIAAPPAPGEVRVVAVPG
jgi:L-iditol 2-dehydrogenase